MRILLIISLLMMLCTKAHAAGCIQSAPEEYSFVNDERLHKTVGLTTHGIIQNVCSVSIKNVFIQTKVFDERGILRHAFRNEVAYEILPGEMREYNFTNKVKYNIDQIHGDAFYQT